MFSSNIWRKVEFALSTPLQPLLDEGAVARTRQSFFAMKVAGGAFQSAKQVKKTDLPSFHNIWKTKHTNQAPMQRNKRLIAVRCTVVMEVEVPHRECIGTGTQRNGHSSKHENQKSAT